MAKHGRNDGADLLVPDTTAVTKTMTRATGDSVTRD